MNSAIGFNYDQSADIERLDFVEESGEPTNKQTFENHLLDVPCHIQPDEAAPSQDLPGSLGKRYIMFCDVQDITEGDRVVIGSDRYRIIGKETFEFRGSNHHMELVLRKF